MADFQLHIVYTDSSLSKLRSSHLASKDFNMNNIMFGKTFRLQVSQIKLLVGRAVWFKTKNEIKEILCF